ncbi:hypothetical protein ACFQ2B_29575 [Streptomyces stramineus]
MAAAVLRRVRHPAPRGAFSDCDHFPDTGRAYCGGLTGRTRADWWAYPDGWPDTATQRAYPVGGRYDPATTVWISGGRLHLRLWRGRTGTSTARPSCRNP